MQLPAVEISSDSESDEETPKVFSSGLLDAKSGAWADLSSDTNMLPAIEEDWSQPPAVDALLLAQGGREDVYEQLSSPVLPRGSPNLAASLTDVLPDTLGRRSPVSSIRDQSPTKLFHIDQVPFSSDSSPLQADPATAPAEAAAVGGQAAAAAAAAAGPRRPGNAPVLSLDILTDADLEDLLHRLRTGTADLGPPRSLDTPSAASSSSISPSPREAPAFSYQPRWARQHQQQEGHPEDAADMLAAAQASSATDKAGQQVQQEAPFIAAAASSSGASSMQQGLKVWSRDHTVQVDLRGRPDGSGSGTTTSSSSSRHATATATGSEVHHADGAASTSSSTRECMPAVTKTHRSCSTSTVTVEAIATGRPAGQAKRHMAASSSVLSQAVVQTLGKQQGRGAMGMVQAVGGGADSDAASDSSEEEWRQMRQQRRAAGRLLGA